MIEPHMVLAVLSLQKAGERPAGPKDEDAFYQQFQKPPYRRLLEAWLRLGMKLRGQWQRCAHVHAAHNPTPVLEAHR